MSTFQIGNRIIGDGHPAYIIAEMSGNHAGSIERAKEIVRAAKESGADCIKIQTYTPDTLTIDCHNKYFQVENGTWEGENLYSLYGKAYTPWEWQKEIKAEADRVGIDFFSTPFDTTAVDFLEEMGVSFYKVASFEAVDLSLLKYIAKTGKPIIMSVGMSSKEEIKEAVEAIYETGNRQLAILKCSSAYPADPKEMNLNTIKDMKEWLQLPVGLSDHSMGSLSASTAVALGANIIEKHFCLGREIENPDASFSMTPSEFREMVDTVRTVESSLGKVKYGVSNQEESSMVFRRSVFVVEDIKKGEEFTEKNTRVIRPGYGEKPKYITDILGKKAECDLERGTPFSFEQLGKGKIVFLTNNENAYPLYDWLCEKEGMENVLLFSNKITVDMIEKLEPAWVISFNYRHFVPAKVVQMMKGRILNLHTSYLPENKGSSPNFFSFLNDTKKGVTIQEMGEGLDKGDIYCQKEMEFDETKETFASSYNRLIEEMTALFREKWDEIKSGSLKPYPQQGEGSYHTMKELDAIREKAPFQWNDNIAAYKAGFQQE